MLALEPCALMGLEREHDMHIFAGEQLLVDTCDSLDERIVVEHLAAEVVDEKHTCWHIGKRRCVVRLERGIVLEGEEVLSLQLEKGHVRILFAPRRALRPSIDECSFADTAWSAEKDIAMHTSAEQPIEAVHLS